MAKTQKTEEWEIATPAFNVTKYVSVLGVAVGGLLAAVPSSLKENTAVVIASIAAGAAVMLGIVVLAAVDILARQRAQEAKRRWPSEEEKGESAQEAMGGDLVINFGGDGQDDSGRTAQAAAGPKSTGRVIGVKPGQSVSVVISEGSD